MNLADTLAKLTRVPSVLGVGISDRIGRCVATAGAFPRAGIEELIRVGLAAHDRVAAADPDGDWRVLTIATGTTQLVVEKLDGGWLLVVFAGDANRALVNTARGFVIADLASMFRVPAEEVPTNVVRAERRAGLAAPDRVGAEVVAHIVRSYERYVGPRANDVISGELTALGATADTLRFSQVADLIRNAARWIPSPRERHEFITSALGDAS